MRKLPLTAAEDLLEIIMRRYERASTIVTSNRPVEDWGKTAGRHRRRQPCSTVCSIMDTCSSAGRAAGGPRQSLSRATSHECSLVGGIQQGGCWLAFSEALGNLSSL